MSLALRILKMCFQRPFEDEFHSVGSQTYFPLENGSQIIIEANGETK